MSVSTAFLFEQTSYRGSGRQRRPRGYGCAVRFGRRNKMATKRKRGGPGSYLGISESESKRRRSELNRDYQKKGHRVNLADANDEFQSMREKCQFKQSKPAEFVKHLMTVHKKYCHDCPRSCLPTTTSEPTSSSSMPIPSTSTCGQNQSVRPVYSPRR